MFDSFYSQEELFSIGLKSFGENVKISKNAKFYSPGLMSVGSNIRIDDFCILSGNISLGSFIHISAYCALYGRFGIEMDDYSGLSPRCTIFSASDDFSGNYMIGPLVKKELTNVTGGKVALGKYSQLGCNCVVLPKLQIGEGVSVGAMSLITHNLESWKIYMGIPAAYYKERSRKLLEFENE